MQPVRFEGFGWRLKFTSEDGKEKSKQAYVPISDENPNGHHFVQIWLPCQLNTIPTRRWSAE